MNRLERERERRPGLAGEIDDLTAEVLKLWAHVKSILRRLEDVEISQRQNQTRYRSELPSETGLSLRPTGVRVKLINWKPPTIVLVALIAAIAFVVWLIFRK